MKSIRYKKYSLIWVLGVFAILCSGFLSSCSDEMLWNGEKIEKDEYLLLFMSRDFKQSDVVTRAVDESARGEIKDLHLLIFGNSSNPAANLLLKDHTIDLDQISSQGGLSGYKFNKSDLPTGRWYLVANAGDKISAAKAATVNDALSEQEFLEIELSGDIDLTSNAPYVLRSDMREMSVTPEAEELGDVQQTDVFELRRACSKVSVQLNLPNNVYFLMTGFYLTGANKGFAGKAESGCMGGAAADAILKLGDNHTLPDGTYNTYEWSDGSSVNYLNRGLILVDYTYPVSADNKPRIVISGCYGEKDQETGEINYNPETFYGVEFPDGCIEAGAWYQCKVIGVGGDGKENYMQAAANPGKIIVEFADKTDNITNIQSDGTNVLAVPDTIHVGANESSKTFTMRYRTDDPDKDCVIEFSSDETNEWLDISSDIELESKASNDSWYAYKMNCTINCAQNQGSDREKVCTVTLGEGSSALTANVVVIQDKSEDMQLSNIFDISLAITGADTADNTTISNYLAAVGQGTADASVKGIEEVDNGGAVRNDGIISPMQTSGVTYTYTIKPKAAMSGAWNITFPNATWCTTGGTKSGTNLTTSTTWTVTFNKSDDFEYKTYNNAITLNVGGTSYSLDIYHTGFLHKHSDTWYYYEVYTAGGRRWLDRNLEATSKGMYSQGANMPDGWPKSRGSIGAYYTQSASRSIPKGFRVPTFPEFSAMTSQSEFNTIAATGYFLPTYTFQGKEYSQSGAKSVSMNVYFPHGRLNGGSAGDPMKGYYACNTSSGETGWYQAMTFTGMNHTSENQKWSEKSMSLRCVDDSQTATSGSVTYTCRVAGYTNVFLYYDNPTTGERAYLTSWPGDQVAVQGTKDRYNLFSLKSYVKYDEKYLKVIFNDVENGDVIASNVSDTRVANRDGIAFRNGGFYNKTLTNSDPTVTGNWKDSDTPDPTPGKKTIGFRWVKGKNNMTDRFRIWSSSGAITDTHDNGGSVATNMNDGYYMWKKSDLDADFTPDKFTFYTGPGAKAPVPAGGETSFSDHSRKETDATLLANYGVDILYTIWAGDSEPTPDVPKKTVGFRWMVDQQNMTNRILMWTSDGTITSAASSGGSVATDMKDGYHMWKTSYNGSYNTDDHIKGFLFMKVGNDQKADGNAGKDITFTSHRVKMENPSLLSHYGVDELYTIYVESAKPDIVTVAFYWNKSSGSAKGYKYLYIYGDEALNGEWQKSDKYWDDGNYRVAFIAMPSSKWTTFNSKRGNYKWILSEDNGQTGDNVTFNSNTTFLDDSNAKKYGADHIIRFWDD